MESKGETMKNRGIPLRYTLLLENRVEENTQFRKESLSAEEKKKWRETHEVKTKTSVLWLKVLKKPTHTTKPTQVWDLAGRIFTVTVNQSLQQSEKQNTVKQGITRTMKTSVLNFEPNIFTDYLDRKMYLLMPKIKLSLSYSTVLLYCTLRILHLKKLGVTHTGFLNIMLMDFRSKSQSSDLI